MATFDQSFPIRGVNTFDNVAYRKERIEFRKTQLQEMELAFAKATTSVAAVGTTKSELQSSFGDKKVRTAGDKSDTINFLWSEQYSTESTTLTLDENSEDDSTVSGEEELDCKMVFLSTSLPHNEATGTEKDAHIATMFEFETKRRSMHHNKLEAIRLRWESSLSILHGGLCETQRSERLILGFIRANDVYASAMETLYDDDSIGSVTDSPLCSEHGSYHTKNDEVDGGIATDSTTRELRDGMLTSLVESQSSVAQQLAEDSQLMSIGIGQDITALRAELETGVKKIEQLGNAIFAELDYMENQIVEAWGKS